MRLLFFHLGATFSFILFQFFYQKQFSLFFIFSLPLEYFTVIAFISSPFDFKVFSSTFQLMFEISRTWLGKFLAYLFVLSTSLFFLNQ